MTQNRDIAGISRLTVPGWIYELSRQVDAAAESDWARFRELAEQELAALVAFETEAGHPVHKGHALYNVGAAVLTLNPASAREFLLAAYVEDVRTWVTRRPKGAVAQRVLRDLFGVADAVFRALSRAARASPETDPRTIVNQVEATFALLPAIPFSVMADQSRNQNDLERDPSKRVFIGGNYRALDRIYNAREVVAAAGLDPVIVREMKTLPGETDREKSLRVLGLCSRVIIDGTEPSAGWVAEIEHLAKVRPDTPLLLVYAARDPQADPPSGMLPTTQDLPAMRQQPYGTPGDMRYHVHVWLTDLGLTTAPLATASWGPSIAGSNTRYVPSAERVSGSLHVPLPGTASPYADEELPDEE